MKEMKNIQGRALQEVQINIESAKFFFGSLKWSLDNFWPAGWDSFTPFVKTCTASISDPSL